MRHLAAPPAILWPLVWGLLAAGCNDDNPARPLPESEDRGVYVEPADLGLQIPDVAPLADAGPLPDRALPPPAPEPVWVTVALQPRNPLYAPGDRARVTATVFDRTGEPIPGAELVWSVAPPGAARLEDGQLSFLADGPGAVVACAGERICGRASFFVDGGPPTLIIERPLRGEALGADGSATLSVAGTATDLGGTVKVRVNNIPVDLGPGGTFSLDLPARFGINRIEVVADDGVQPPIRDVRQVLWAPAYGPVEVDRAIIEDAIGLRVDQALLDGDRPVVIPGEAGAVVLQDAAQILELLVSLADVTAVLGDPQLADGDGFSLRVEGVDLGKPEIDLFFTGAGAELFMRLPRISVRTAGQIQIEGAPISLDGALRASIAAFARLDIALEGGALRVDVADVGIAVESIAGQFESPTAEVLVQTFGSRLGNLARGLAEELVFGLIEEQLPALITGALDDILRTLADVPLELAAPIEGVPPLSLHLAITPQALDLGRRSLMGLRLAAAIRHPGPVLAPHADPGIPLGGPTRLDWIGGEGLGATVGLSLLNGLLHEVWRAGLLQLTPALPGEAALILSSVAVDGRLAPVVAPAPSGSALPLEVQVGDLRIAVVGRGGAQPDRYAVDLRVGLSVEAQGGQLALVVGERPEIEATLIAQAGARPFLSGEQLAVLLEGLVWPQVQQALAGGLAFGIDPVAVDPATLAGVAPRVVGLSLAPQFEGVPTIRSGRAQLEGGLEVVVDLAAP